MTIHDATTHHQPAPDRAEVHRPHPPTFDTMVVSRRIGVGPDRIVAFLQDPPHITVALADGSKLLVELMTPSQGFVGVRWNGRGQIRPARNRLHRSLPIDVEVASWSADSGEIQIGPATRHLPRWGSRRLDRYFELAHEAADHLRRALHEPMSAEDAATTTAAVSPDRLESAA